jgi:hypothetical protein
VRSKRTHELSERSKARRNFKNIESGGDFINRIGLKPLDGIAREAEHFQTIDLEKLKSLYRATQVAPPRDQRHVDEDAQSRDAEPDVDAPQLWECQATSANGRKCFLKFETKRALFARVRFAARGAHGHRMAAYARETSALSPLSFAP